MNYLVKIFPRKVIKVQTIGKNEKINFWKFVKMIQRVLLNKSIVITVILNIFVIYFYKKNLIVSIRT